MRNILPKGKDIDWLKGKNEHLLPANIKDIDLAPLVRQLNAKAVNVPLSSTKDRLMSPLSKTLTTNNLDQFVRVTNNDNDLILQQQSLENTMHILTSTQIATKNINDLENSISQWKQKEEPNLK
ncbi:17831_t:CDS:2 [Rhizophagus irregularis]|nr:17831_t:CDS:2 [Rhizophagus irregularis]